MEFPPLSRFHFRDYKEPTGCIVRIEVRKKMSGIFPLLENCYLGFEDGDAVAILGRPVLDSVNGFFRNHGRF